MNQILSNWINKEIKTGIDQTELNKWSNEPNQNRKLKTETEHSAGKNRKKNHSKIWSTQKMINKIKNVYIPAEKRYGNLAAILKNLFLSIGLLFLIDSSAIFELTSWSFCGINFIIQFALQRSS